MDSLVTMSPLELERLLITIESSQQVHRRYQFFLWSQGALQSFLPHDVLVVGYGEYGTPAFRCEVLARSNICEDRAMTREVDNLVQLAVDAWHGAGCMPRLFKAGGKGEGADAIGAILALLIWVLFFYYRDGTRPSCSASTRTSGRSSVS